MVYWYEKKLDRQIAAAVPGRTAGESRALYMTRPSPI